jgi:hypothetical protein
MSKRASSRSGELALAALVHALRETTIRWQFVITLLSAKIVRLLKIAQVIKLDQK